MIELGDFIGDYRIVCKVTDSSLSSIYVAEHTSARATPVLITFWHGIRFTTSGDTQTFLKKARHGVIFRNSQTISLRDAQLYDQSPYVVTAFNERASAILATHTKFVDLVVANRRALHPDNPHAAIGAFLSVFCTRKGARPFFDLNALIAGDNITRTVPRILAGLKPWKPTLLGRIYIAVSIVLLLAVLAGGMPLLINFLPANAATVTITPVSERITHTYAVSLVTGDPRAGQIVEHTISYTMPPQSQTGPVTGKGHHDASTAQGQVVISQIHLFNASDNNTLIDASTVSANDGTMITVGGFTATEGETVTVNATASNTGQSGNISAGDINGPYNIYQYDQFHIQQQLIGTAYIQNPNAFTGGQDAGDYTYVQQRDIDGVATPLLAQVMPIAQQRTQQELQAGEQFVQDITCSHSVTTDHQVQETAYSVTVIIHVTCSGTAYNKQDLLAAAINAQKADEVTQYGTSYQPSGNITTGVPNLSTSSQDGPVVYEVPTDGIWVFQVDSAQQQEIASSIAGHPQRDATSQILQRKGIKSVVITTAGGIGTALPASPGNIQITIVHVLGPTAS